MNSSKSEVDKKLNNEDEYELPYNGYYFIDKYATPYYQIIYISELIATVYLAVFSGALDCFVASFLVCFCGLINQVSNIS